jgi:Sulfotransferase family
MRNGSAKIDSATRHRPYGNAMDRIASLLPRFAHIIRDGRDVMLSVRGLWFRPGDSVEACAADWTARVARARALGSQVPHYLEIRYEQLVTFPEATLESICCFLELSFDPLMLTYHTRAPARLEEHEARHDADGRLMVAKAQRLDNQRYVTEPSRLDRIGRWKKEMRESEVLRFDAVAGEWLDRLGYDRGR